MELKLIRNGTKKVANKRRTKRRKNTTPSTTAKAANGAKRRNGTTRAGATSWAKRNGLVLRKAENGKRKKTHRRKHRNGSGTIRKVNNGVLGNSKETVMAVVSLLAGLGITKVESSILTPLAARALNMLGLGQFAQPLVEAGCAVSINRWAADALKKGSGKYVMYGGLAMALMDVLQSFLPQTSAYNPFASVNTAPIVLNQPSVVVPNAVAAGAGAPAAVGSIIRPRVGTGYARPMIIRQRQVY